MRVIQIFRKLNLNKYKIEKKLILKDQKIM